MAFTVDEHSNFKHYCKICKKGFWCGSALGGHMRTHGVGDENGHLDDDDDEASDWGDKFGANVPPSNRRMYALRTNPNRLKSCRVCENCGKEFLSWKSFLEHGKCGFDGDGEGEGDRDAESLVSYPSSDSEDGIPRGGGCGGSSKRKRSFRANVGSFPNCPSSEEEDLANCLMMLSNAIVDPLLAEPEESCTSASKEEERRNNTMSFVAPIACRIRIEKGKGATSRGLFECKACKKVFNSHQALGGHRASHKKVKGCFAAGLDHADEDHDAITYEEFFPAKSNPMMAFQFHHQGSPVPSTSKRKSKVHECSICGRVFSSGQALGGHKRCHWITSNSSAEPASLAKFHHQFKDHMEQIQQRPKLVDNSEPLELKLNLNLPASSPQVNNPASFSVPTEILLLPWIGVESKDNDGNGSNSNEHKHHHEENNNDNNNNDNNNNKNNDNNNNKDNKCSNSSQNTKDEADSKLKLEMLSEQNGSSSPWLQVGIGSTSGR